MNSGQAIQIFFPAADLLGARTWPTGSIGRNLVSIQAVERARCMYVITRRCMWCFCPTTPIAYSRTAKSWICNNACKQRWTKLPWRIRILSKRIHCNFSFNAERYNCHWFLAIRRKTESWQAATVVADRERAGPKDFGSLTELSVLWIHSIPLKMSANGICRTQRSSLCLYLVEIFPTANSTNVRPWFDVGFVDMSPLVNSHLYLVKG